MTESTDPITINIDRLSEVVGEERLDVLHGMRPEERDAVLLRLLAQRERLRLATTEMLHRVDEALGPVVGILEDL